MVYEMRIGWTSTVGGAAIWVDLGDDLPVAEEFAVVLPRITLRRNSTGCGGKCSTPFMFVVADDSNVVVDPPAATTKLQTSH